MSVDASLHVLTVDSARKSFPDLFEGDECEPYFNEQGPDGNTHWVDYWPDVIVIAVAANGTLLFAGSGSRWLLEKAGITPS